MLSNTCASIVNRQHVPETSIAQPADNIVGTTSIGGAVLEGLLFVFVRLVSQQ